MSKWSDNRICLAIPYQRNPFIPINRWKLETESISTNNDFCPDLDYWTYEIISWNWFRIKSRELKFFDFLTPAEEIFFLQWCSWHNSLNWSKVSKCLNFIWQTWYLKYKLFTLCFCPWVFWLLWKPKLFFRTFITTRISIF